jgi:hypothetical protein
MNDGLEVIWNIDSGLEEALSLQCAWSNEENPHSGADRDSNREPPEYKSRTAPTVNPVRSVVIMS